MKRIIISLFIIGLTVGGVATATYAYFSAGKVIGDNTFTTGNVSLDGTVGLGLNVQNLVPGESRTITNVGVKYDGNIPADLYLGARGTSGPDDPQFFANVLTIVIKDRSDDTVVYNGLVSGLSTAWRSIATNVNPNTWKTYDITLTLDSSVGNDKMNKTNTDTKLLIYAVQKNGPTPTTLPMDTTGSDVNTWL